MRFSCLIYCPNDHLDNLEVKIKASASGVGGQQFKSWWPTQMNLHAARVLKPPTTSCSPAPPSMTWDARHGPVWWRPTGSFGDRLRHCSRLQTSPYSPDWKSSMAGNAEEEVEILMVSYQWFNNAILVATLPNTFCFIRLVLETVTHAKISPKVVNPRDIAGNAEEEVQSSMQTHA